MLLGLFLFILKNGLKHTTATKMNAITFRPIVCAGIAFFVLFFSTQQRVFHTWVLFDWGAQVSISSGETEHCTHVLCMCVRFSHLCKLALASATPSLPSV